MINLTPNVKKIKFFRSQQGVVLVMALFIVMLVAAISYAMMARLARDTKRVSFILRNNQAEFYAQGSIAWAIDQLYNDWIKQKPTHLIDNIPIKSPISKMNGYTIVSTIYDMQARFNLNNLQTPDAQNDFLHLLLVVEPKLSMMKAKELVESISNWMTPRQQLDKFNQYYSTLSPPYLAANRFYTSVSELRLVKGMTPKLFNSLEPYVTALPTVTPINVQTADVKVLMSLSPKLTLATAKTIAQIRLEKPFVNPKIFLDLDVIRNTGQTISPNKITTVSQYFLVQTEVSIEKQRIVLYTLLERLSTDGRAIIHPLWQGKSVW